MGWRFRGSAVALAALCLAASCSGTADEASPSNPEASQPTFATDSTNADGSDPAPTESRAVEEDSADGPPAGDESNREAEVVDLRLASREELIDLWAADRARVVDRIVAAGWGVDADDVLNGPGGMRLDLSRCPTGWRNTGPTEGPTNGNSPTVPLNWWPYYHGPGSDAAQDFLDWLGPDGHVRGRPIELVYGGYTDADFDFDQPGTEEQKQQRRRYNEETVVAAEQRALAVVAFNEWSSNLRFRDLLSNACLPSIGRRSALEGLQGSALTTKPWSVPATRLQFASLGEFWVRLVAERWVDKRIGLLVMEQDFGTAVAAPVLAAAEELGLDVISVGHDPAGSEISAEMAELLAAEPDVILAATAGNTCHLVVEEVARVAPDVPVLIPDVCVAPNDMTSFTEIALGEVFSLRSMIDGTEVDHRSPLGVLVNDSFDTTYPFLGYTADWLPMWQAVQILQIAAELPGGLIRTNLVLAGWAFEGRHPLLEGPITVGYPEDPTAVDVVRLYRRDRDSPIWQPTDTLIDLTD